MLRATFVIALLLLISCTPQQVVVVVTATPPAPAAISAPSPIATGAATTSPSPTVAPTETWTPTTLPSPSVTPSPLPPTPTVDMRATEQKIASLIFATLTAAAPTMTAVPQATLEHWRLLCREVPTDQAGLVVTNYIGEKDLVVIIGKTKTIATRGSDTLILVPPGKFDANFLAEGWGKGWNWVRKFEIGPGECWHQQVWYTSQ
jgi:hypothetical protein